MVKPDLVTVWPDNCDYPIFRRWLADNRHRFNDAVVCVTETNQTQNFFHFLVGVLQGVADVMQSPPHSMSDDWRNAATNYALTHTSVKSSIIPSEWVLFMEQDYVIDNDAFWMYIYHAIEQGFEALAHFEGDRMHPAFLMMKYSLLEKTRKDFGIIPDKADHFYKIYEDIMALGSPIYRVQGNAHHLNGLSSNMTLVQRGEAPNYKKDEFDLYLTQCMLSPVKLDEEWKRIYLRYFCEQGKKILA